jgi:hypothetical protein
VQFLGDKAALAALHAVTAPGGTLASPISRGTSARRAPTRRVAEEIAATLKAAGYGEIRVEELPLKPVPAVCVLGRRPGAGLG